MKSSTVDVPAPDGAADAYVARPDDRPYPGVLFLMDAFGLRPAIEEMVERIAADGYVVLAPNLFYRTGRSPVVPVTDLADPERHAAIFDVLRPMIEQLTPERTAADGAAYLDYLAQVAVPGPFAMTGYCMGGRAGWRIAAAERHRVAALGAFHTAGLVTEAPDSPHRSAGELDGAELYFGFADGDRYMTVEQIATLERALDDAAVRYRADIYDGAQHGYTMSDLPAHDEAARERHFAELRALLERTVGQ